MNNNTSQNEKLKYRGYTYGEKLLPTVLLAVFAPFMICLFGPFDIYGNNSDQFKFVLGDFTTICFAVALCISALIFGLLMLLRSYAYDAAYGALLGISLMLFVQGNYLNIGMNSLEGDGVGNIEVSRIKIVVNIVIWIAVIAACTFSALFFHRFGETVRIVSIVALITLIGMTVVSFITISLTTDVYSSRKAGLDDNVDIGDEVLTVKNLDTLATKENIVIFIIDRFDYEYYDRALAACPEIFDELEGFTYFDDYVTLYPRTFPAITYTITGVETDFTSSRTEYMEEAYSKSEYLNTLSSLGYDINIYTDSYYGYENASHMREYTKNVSGNIEYEIVEKNKLSLDMIRLSLYRYLPIFMRDVVGNISTPTFDKYVVYESEYDAYSTDMKDVYTVLAKDAFEFRNSKRGFSFIHISGCHLPNLYDENFNEASEDDLWSTNSAMKQSFKIINTYISEMKRMGVYENATIIITGDHASIGSDSKAPYYEHITSLFVKPAGVSKGEITESKAQVSQRELFATVLSAAGVDESQFGTATVFDVPEDVDMIRRYLFQRYDSGEFEFIEYEIVGNSHDFDNWHIINRYALGKSIYD